MNGNKLFLYLLFAFAISWFFAAIIKIFGLSLSDPLSTVLIGMGFMFGPAVSTILTRKLYFRESLKNIGLRFDKSKLKWYIALIGFYLMFIIFAFVSIWLVGNVLNIPNFGSFDFTQAGLTQRLAELIRGYGDANLDNLEEISSISPLSLASLLALGGIVAGFTINGLVAFGEEFGWRGFLLEESKSLGFWGSSLFIGVIWGLWHAPLISMGHNFPNSPILGIFWMCIFTVILSPVMTYLRIKTRSVIGPSIFHGLINTTGGFFQLYVNNPNELFASPVGLSGVIAVAIITFLIWFFDRKTLNNFSSYLD
ncbi:MAG: lysostaphin resistance A-like protein [Patescibacteria group bacterium]